MTNHNHLANCFASLAVRLQPDEFANVVAAWRGPDDGDEPLKVRTTGVIRRAILDEIGPGWEKELRAGSHTTISYFRGFVVAKKEQKIVLPRNPGEWEKNIHFFSHIRSAATALKIGVTFR